jgi:hypothetical protein
VRCSRDARWIYALRQATQSAVPNNECRNIAIAALVESGTNPRKGFDQAALEELAASFKTQDSSSSSSKL